MIDTETIKKVMELANKNIHKIAINGDIKEWQARYILEAYQEYLENNA